MIEKLTWNQFIMSDPDKLNKINEIIDKLNELDIAVRNLKR